VKIDKNQGVSVTNFFYPYQGVIREMSGNVGATFNRSLKGSLYGQLAGEVSLEVFQRN
jgi:hypothetical protein